MLTGILKRLKLILLSALLVHTLFISFIWQTQLNNIRSESYNNFLNDIQKDTSYVVNKLEGYAEILYGVRGLFAASEEVTHSEWDAYLQSINVLERYKGITGVAFSFKVDAEDKEDFLQTLKKSYSNGSQVLEDITIFPEQAGSGSSFILSYLEPLDLTVNSVGYDLSTEPIRNSTILRSIEVGTIVATSPLKLIKDNGQISYVTFLPVYNKETDLQSSQSKLEHTIGVISVAFNMKDTLDSLFLDYTNKDYLHLSALDLGEGSNSDTISIYESNNLTTDMNISHTIKFKIAERYINFKFLTGDFYNTSPVIPRNTNIFFLFIMVAGYITLIVMYFRFRKVALVYNGVKGISDQKISEIINRIRKRN